MKLEQIRFIKGQATVNKADGTTGESFKVTRGVAPNGSVYIARGHGIDARLEILRGLNNPKPDATSNRRSA